MKIRFYSRESVLSFFLMCRLIIGDKKIKSGQPISVRLVHKDGSEEETEAALFWAHFNPGGYRLNCVFPNATKEQVPIGTEIWLLEEDAP